MTEAENGRHCKSCDKIVIDFSVLSDDEVRSFFLKNSSKPVCGRFHKNQIDRIRIHIPSYVLNKPLPYWKKFLIIFLVCFGSNLYPFDTFINSTPGIYAQSSSDKPARKKINNKLPKKKIWLIKEVTVKLAPQCESIIMGLTQTVPAPPFVPALAILTGKVDSSPTDSVTISPETTNDKEYGRRKKPSNKPNSEDSREYILPARLEYQRRKPKAK